MAVSQFLRPKSIVDAVRSHFTPDVVRKASSLVGESESSTAGALNSAVPSVLSGLVNMVSSGEGANALSGLVRNGGYGAAAENVFSLFGGGSSTHSMLSSGQQLLSRIFGNKSSSVADIISRSSGVSSSSAGKLLALAAPLTLGVIGKTSQTDASSLASTILNGRSDIAAAAPAGLSQLLSGSPTAVRSEVADPRLSAPVAINHFSEPVAAAPPVTRVEEHPRGGGLSWLPLLLIALAGLGLLLYFRGRGREAVNTGVRGVEDTMARVELPGGRSLSVPAGSMNYNLASFLADRSAGPLPKTFVFDHLNFESATTELTADSTPTVNNLAEVLKAYPSARVQLVGHTDNTGTPEANQTLSLDRANAVKTMLVTRGVSPEAISTTGYGESRPVASNDTEEGRERNRRLELNVISK